MLPRTKIKPSSLLLFLTLLFPVNFSLGSTSVYTAGLSSVSHIPWSSQVSIESKQTTKFTTATSLPANGKILITYPAGFDISSATFDSWSDFNGGQSISISGQVITITRDNTGTSSPAGAKYIVLSGIINRATAASTYTVMVETKNSEGTTLDGSTASMVFSITPTDDGLDTNAPWAKGNADYRNTAQGKTAGPEYPTIKWAYGSGYGDSHTSIIQDSAGNLYFGGDRMISLTSAGVLRWETAISAWDFYPALAANGTVYGMNGSYLRAYNKDTGAELWSYNISNSDNYNTGVVIGPDGTVYVFGRYSTDYAINSDGTLKWSSSSLSLNTRSTPSFAIDPVSGEMIISGENGFKRLFPDGRTIGTASGGNFVNDPTVLAADGSAYVSGRNAGNGVFAMNSNGSLKWSTASLGGTNGASGISLDGSRFFTRSGDCLYSINTTNGATAWTSTAISGFTWTASLAVDPFNETVYFGNHSRKQSDGSLKWKYTAMGNCDSPTIGKDGILYCLQHYSATYSVFAIQPWTIGIIADQTHYKIGDVITLLATSSMLQRDPAASEDNQVQAVMPNGDKVALSYDSSSDGNTIWTGTYTIPSGTTDGVYTATVQAGAYKVETDVVTTFATAPTGSNNTGITDTFTYTVDNTAPTGSMTINSGDTYTILPEVTLTLTATDATSGVSQMMVSEDSTFTGASWETYATTKSMTLSSGDGTKTVYVKFKDQAGNISEVYSDTIILDGTAPSDEISINSNATYTKAREVTLTIDATDVLSGVYQMMISEQADLSDGTWETYATTKSWTLSTGDGTKTIYLKFKDLAGNISSIFHDSIILDTTVPITLLKLGNTDFNSDIASWEVTSTKPPFSGTTDPNATVTITLSPGTITGTTTADATGAWSWTPTTDISLGTYTVTVTSQDLAGNTKSLSFTLEVKGATAAATTLPDTGIPLALALLTILFFTLSGWGTKFILKLHTLLSNYKKSF